MQIRNQFRYRFRRFPTKQGTRRDVSRIPGDVTERGRDRTGRKEDGTERGRDGTERGRDKTGRDSHITEAKRGEGGVFESLTC